MYHWGSGLNTISPRNHRNFTHEISQIQMLKHGCNDYTINMLDHKSPITDKLLQASEKVKKGRDCLFRQLA